MKKLGNRQGEVLYYAIDALPKDTFPIPGKIVKQGNENHQFRATDDVQLYRINDSNDRIAIVNTESELMHKNHASFKITPGTYLFTSQQEKTIAGEFQDVMD